jgi:hypothetical protein
MTETDIEFVGWYRKFFKFDKDLPCLKCTDNKIVKCGNADTVNGCVQFHQYLHQKERPSPKVSLDKLT